MERVREGQQPAPPTVLYAVMRSVQFADGSASSVPMRLFSDQGEAVVFKNKSHQHLVERFNDPQFATLLAEIGVVGCAHGVKPIQAPDSRIVIPQPHLIVPA